MTLHPEEVVKRVLETKEGSKNSYSRIAAQISKELSYDLDAEDVKEIWLKAKELLDTKSQELEEINNAIQDKKKYEVIDGNYIITVTKNTKAWEAKQVFKIPVETVDNIFNDYSKHGRNMSWQAIMTKYKLKPKAWSAIKSQIWLYKDSHILSPMSMDIAEGEGNTEQVIEEATYNNFQDKYKDKYHDAHITTLEKEYKKLAKARGTLEWFLSTVRPMLNSIKPIKVEALKHSNYKWQIPVYHIGDPHLWKVNTEAVVARLMQVATDINKEPSKEIYINCLGDIFETLVSGGMHIGQIETMGWMYGADLFMYWVNVFVDFLTRILKTGKTVHFIGIWGNHDRATQLNEWDPNRIFATVFYEMLKAYMANTKTTFQIIREKIGMFEVDGIQYLSHHWERLDKKNPEKIAWKFAETGKPVVIVSAHEHNEQLYTGKNVTHMKINALAGQNQYDKDLLLDSYAGYSKTVANEFWLPDIHSKRLP